MNKKSKIIGWSMILVTLICLVGVIVAPMVKKAQVRHFFVDRIYCLLSETATELEAGWDAVHSIPLYQHLADLDVKYADAAMVSGTKALPLQQSFSWMAYEIHGSAYKDDELKQMGAALRELVWQLSDESGTRPRQNISYQELSEHIVAFLEEWIVKPEDLPLTF